MMRPLEWFGGSALRADGVDLSRGLLDVAAGEGSQSSAEDAGHSTGGRVVPVFFGEVVVVADLGEAQQDRVTLRVAETVVVPETVDEPLSQCLPRADGSVQEIHQPCEGWALECQGQIPHQAPVAPPGR